jgi:hypothetical protein
LDDISEALIPSIPQVGDLSVSILLVTLMAHFSIRKMEALFEPPDVKTQKTAIFMGTAVVA